MDHKFLLIEDQAQLAQFVQVGKMGGQALKIRKQGTFKQAAVE